ncbi:MAG: hypothetical protein IKV39_00175 [Clostridia bacterium]|nr:hypothetical protein [Clostridia bacterium]
MKLLYTNTSRYYIDKYLADIEIETDGDMLYVTVGPDRFLGPPTDGVELFISYNGEERDMSSSPFRTRRASFTYDEGVKSVTLMVGNGDTLVHTWAGGASDSTPKASVSMEGFRHYEQYKITYSCNSLAGHTVSIIGAVAHIWSEERQTWYTGDYNLGTGSSGSFTKMIDGTADYWDKVQFDIYFGAYRSGAEGYVGVYKYSSPTFNVVDSSSAYAPHSLTYSGIRAGGSGEIYWYRLYDSKHKGVYYELQRSINGEEFSRIYTGQDMEFIDTLPEDTVSVAYRVGVMEGTNVFYWCEGERIGTSLCNVYVCVDGKMKQAAAVYIGKDGVPAPTTSLFEVG